MLNNAEIIYSADGTTQKLIAHVQDTLLADRAYGINDQFIYAGVLYRCTAAIAQGAEIVLTGSGVNAVASKVVVDQTYSIDDDAETDIQDGDYLPFYDASATAKRKSLWSNIKSVLKTYFDTLYAALSHTHTKSQITDFPTIPTVNNATLTIQKNGTNVATFTANASSNVTANITVPTIPGWTFVKSVTGSTKVTLPTGWKEVLALCQYGNSSGMQAQRTSTFLIPALVSGSYSYSSGGGTVSSQVILNAANSIYMVYFGVSGTAYTTTSQMHVYVKV